jgi:hypothetical protein
MTARYQTLSEGGVWDFVTLKKIKRGDPDWPTYQAWLTGGGEPMVPDAVGQMSVSDAKAARISDINSYAAGLRNRVIAGRSVGEMASWTIKLDDAMAVKSGRASPYTAMLPALGKALGLAATPTSINDALGKVRGITEGEHADKVLAQALPALVAEISIDAIRGKHCDAITAVPDAAPDSSEIAAYDWLAGWPTIPAST